MSIQNYVDDFFKVFFPLLIIMNYDSDKAQ